MLRIARTSSNPLFETPKCCEAPKLSYTFYFDQDFGEYRFRSIHETEIRMNTPDVIYKIWSRFSGLWAQGFV